MKRIFTFIATILLSSIIFAQTPEKISYQAVVRDADNNLITNQTIGMQISILQGSAVGTPVYVEIQTSTSNANGLVTIEIGNGTTSDDFSAIDWTNGLYFIKTETDPEGGNNYTITGSSQILSVPYALHAKTAENISGGILEADPVFNSSDAANITNTDISNWNNKLDAEVDGDATNELQALSISNDTIYLSNGNFVKLPAGFSGSFNDLTDVPANLDTDVTDDFNGDFSNLSNIPAGLADGDDNTQLSEAEVDAYVANNGYITAEVDGSVTNEIQDLQLVGNILTITNNGTATDIDLSAYLDNTDTQLSEAEVDAYVANNGYLTAEVDGSVTNEIQDLQLVGNILTITNNGTATDIDLLAYLDNTDTQLSEAEVDAYVANNGYLTSEADGDPTNELELPSQTGNSGKYLTTNGTSVSWATVAGASTPTLSEVTNNAMEMNSGTVVLPRISTATRDGIATPIPGMMIYNTTTGIFQGYKSSVDQVFSNTSGATSTSGTFDQYNTGTEFNPNFDGTIKKIAIKPMGTRVGQTMRIYTGTVASHTEVYSQTYNEIADTEVEITLTTPFVFSSGNKYIIMFESNMYYGGTDYLYGTQVYITNSTGVWATDASDIYMKLTVDVNSWVDLH